MALNILPTEMLTHIFSYLDRDDLCRLTGQVCEGWQCLSYNPMLCGNRNVELDQRTQSPNEITRIVSNSSLSRSFVFSEISDWAFVSYLPKCDNLRKLTFDSCIISEFDISQLVTALPLINCVRLKYKRTERCDLSEIVRWNFLKNLTIETMGEGSLDMNASLDFLRNTCPNLESLILGPGISFDNRSLLNFAKSHGGMMKTLNARFGHAYNGYQFITMCPNITDLDLAVVLNMTGEELLNLKELQFLQKLKISGTFTLTAGNFVTLFQECIFLHLIDLQLGCAIDLNDTAIECMSKSCPSLKYLCLFGSKNVTDEGIKRVVKNSKNMEIMSLINLQITGSGLTECQRKMLNLIQLDVVGCKKVEHEILLKLVSEKPNLCIQDCHWKIIKRN